MNKTLIIAEIGVNHNGCLETAKKMIDRAKISGADYVKFQSFFASSLVTKNALKSDYQKVSENDKSTQLEMLSELEFNNEQFDQIFKYCKIKNIGFLSTGFDFQSMEILKSYDMDYIKVPSGEITNLPMLQYVSKLKKPIIMSTGMSTIKEIDAALKILNSNGVKNKNITLLQCTSEYPTPLSQANLNIIPELRKIFDISVGFSDHTIGFEAALGAVALGASIIEKHFTLDKSQKGPDHKTSIEPEEFKKMVNFIRGIETALGSSIKKPTIAEEKNKIIVRKSIVAKKKINKGEIFDENNLTTKRPANGISPMMIESIIGKKSKRDFEQDELIEI